MERINALMPKLNDLTKVSKKDETEYGYYLNESRKMIGQPYIVLHKRLERAFFHHSFEFLLSKLKQWYHEAEKSDNRALTFNARFKQFRERQAEAVANSVYSSKDK